MMGIRRLQLIAGRAVGAAHPNTLLAVVTTIVFAIALGVSWTTPTEAQCPGGADTCLWNPSTNPCSIYSSTSCELTGPGYTCMVAGNPNPQPEGTWKIIAAKTWQMCSSPGGGPGKTCTPSFLSCGTTYHYVSGYVGCTKSCTGNWYWEACCGAGDLC